LILSERDNEFVFVIFPFEFDTVEDIYKLVVSVPRGHFMNSVFVNPGSHSCAVDAFMEISTHLFLPYLSNLRTRTSCIDIELH